jgi:transcriptional regulator with XRE-family HTH domain
MNLGRAIKLCRSQRELKQQALADKAGLSVSYLSLLEQNKRDPSLSTVKELANALDVPFSVLMFLAADKEDLSGLDPELAEKLAFSALTLLRESNGDQKTLL